MTVSLHPCGACRRHVRIDEARCPFCGASPGAPVASTSRAVTTMTRAAIFAGAALLVPACSSKKSSDGVEQPPPAKPADAATVRPVDAAAIDAAPPADAAPAPDAAVAKKKTKKKRNRKKKIEPDPNSLVPPDSDPPYGAPPSPDDFIV